MEETVASKVPFLDLCKICDKIVKKQGKEKKNVLISFIGQWRDYHEKLHRNKQNVKDSFYPAMRLLLPHLDQERGAYGIKELTLAKLYIEVLCLAKDSSDAMKLLNYRAPQNAKSEAGDFANVAYYVLKNRCPTKGTLTVADINESLDAIALNNSSRNKTNIRSTLMNLLRNTSAEEQKWLIRIIMKSMKLGISETTVFNVFHLDAKDLYDVSNSLSKVCTALHDPSVRLNEIEIALFEIFRPMLSETYTTDKVEKLMEKNAKTYYVETKHDGERMQFHTDGTRFMYVSRRGNDFTSSFGGTALSGPLTRNIIPSFNPKMKNCILDGEMVGYNKTINCLACKSENFDVKSLASESEYQPCFCVFDVLMYNDKVLSNIPLKERIQYLKEIFTPIEGYILYTPRTEVTTKAEVIDLLNTAIDNREEGIVFKDPQSIYKPNTRNNGGWYKIKPEYVDGLIDNLDLLIIGGYFGEGRRSGLVSQFLLGVAVPDKDGGKPKVFESVGRVGSGYSLQELYQLCMNLNEHWQVYDRRRDPPCIDIGSGNKERPDLWIEPEKSTIVEVKAAEITKSYKFKTGYTLRFPRVIKVRDDKNWFDCLTVTDFHKLREDCQGKLASRHVSVGTDLDADSPVKKKPRVVVKIEPTLASHFKGVDPKSVKQIDNFFSGRCFCVINTPQTLTKHSLEEQIIQHGGKIVQHPIPKTCVVADSMSLRVRNMIASENYDVVKCEWVLECIRNKSWLQFHPLSMWYCTEETKQQLSAKFDKFGDNFVSPIKNRDELVEIFNAIKVEGDLIDIKSIEDEFFPNSSDLGLFRQCYSYFVDDDEMITLIKLKFKFYGGCVETVISDSTTHVIFSDRSSPVLVDEYKRLNRNRNLKFHLVSELWILNSASNKMLLNENNYQL